MTDAILLVDVGASRIKGVCWSRTHHRVLAQAERPAPTLQHGARGEVEGEPERYWEALTAVLTPLVASHPEVRDLWICAEMHGFLLADPHTRAPRTPYISWQDQRACQAEDGSVSAYDRLAAQAADAVMTETGMRIRPGMPLVTLAAMRDEVERLGPARFLTLIDWLLMRGGSSAPRAHRTMAVATGLYSLADAAWSDALIERTGLPRDLLQLPAVVQDLTAPIGTIHLADRALRVWGGVGDLQAAAHGAGFPAAAPVLINLGTGSQVLVHVSERDLRIEGRPTVTGGWAEVVTHIPAGRALNAFARFIDDCAQSGGGEPVFWDLFGSLTFEEVVRATPTIDLNLFPSAWRYTDGGRITGITEASCTLRPFMAVLVRSWLGQYVEALHSLPSRSSGSVLLGGGLSRRSPCAHQVLESLLGMSVIPRTLRTGEETLDGLLAMAESIEG